MKRVQFGMRHLLIAALLSGIVVSIIALNSRELRLKEQERTVERFASKSVSEDWKLKVLRGLSVDLEHQREAIGTLLKYWDRLEFRNVGLWPEIDDRKLNTMIFADAFPRGTTIAVVVLMDWDTNTAVDAVSYVATSDTAQVIIDEDIDGEGNYALQLWDNPSGDDSRLTVRKKWTIKPLGYVEQ